MENYRIRVCTILYIQSTLYSRVVVSCHLALFSFVLIFSLPIPLSILGIHESSFMIFFAVALSILIKPKKNPLQRPFHASTNLKMSSKRVIAKAIKRKATLVPVPPSKKVKSGPPPFRDSATAVEYGIVDREFYPPEMTNERCQQYIDNDLIRPIEALNSARKD